MTVSPRVPPPPKELTDFSQKDVNEVVNEGKGQEEYTVHGGVPKRGKVGFFKI